VSAAGAAHHAGHVHADAFHDVPVGGSRDGDDDLMALGLDASELQEFFGDA
jgi:hypothetical protein